jgi:hypothetical protein
MFFGFLEGVFGVFFLPCSLTLHLLVELHTFRVWQKRLLDSHKYEFQSKWFYHFLGDLHISWKSGECQNDIYPSLKYVMPMSLLNSLTQKQKWQESQNKRATIRGRVFLSPLLPLLLLGLQWLPNLGKYPETSQNTGTS